MHTYHTLYEDYTHYLKISGNQKLKGIVRYLSRVCCNRPDVVIVPTEKIKKIIQGYGVIKNIVVQPTGIGSFVKFENSMLKTWITNMRITNMDILRMKRAK